MSVSKLTKEKGVLLGIILGGGVILLTAAILLVVLLGNTSTFVGGDPLPVVMEGAGYEPLTTKTQATSNQSASNDSTGNASSERADNSISETQTTGQPDQPVQLKSVTFSDNGQVLKNPLMGWQYYAFPKEILTTGIPKEFDVAVIKTSWDVLEPKDNQFDWELLDRSIRKLRAEGRTVYLRLYLMPDDVWAIDGIPEWLWSKYHVPYQEIEGRLNATGEYNIRHPEYWDKTYQAQVKEFLTAFTNHYQDGAVDVVDLRCYGIYGEWDSDWLPFDWKGDMAKKQKTLNELVNLYKDAFAGHKRTKVAINVSSAQKEDNEAYYKEAAFDNALNAGFALRFDGVGDRHSSKLFANYLLEQHFPGMPVFAETWFGFDDVKFSVPNTVKAFLKMRVNSATFGFFKGNYYKMLDGYKELFDDTLKAGGMGYRLLPKEISYTDTVSANGELTLQSIWENLNVGTCYNQYPLSVKLRDAKGNIVYKDTDFSFDQTGWVQGKDYAVTSRFRLPDTKYLPKGEYQLSISLVDTNLVPAISLPIGKDGNAKEYMIGSVTVQ